MIEIGVHSEQIIGIGSKKKKRYCNKEDNPSGDEPVSS
jgi:hypothetical protein